MTAGVFPYFMRGKQGKVFCRPQLVSAATRECARSLDSPILLLSHPRGIWLDPLPDLINFKPTIGEDPRSFSQLPSISLFEVPEERGLISCKGATNLEL